MPDLRLDPADGVIASADGFVAQSLPAWLSASNFFEVCGRNWFFIRYACSFFDRPSRPLIRFHTMAGREYTYLMNGAVLGTAEWVGRVPDNAVSVFICATDRIGPFGFRIDDARPVSKVALMRKNMTAGMSRSRRLINNRRSDARQFEVDLYKIANPATPLARYHDWQRRFSRAPEPYGFDAPRSDWASGPTFGLALDLDRRTSAASLEVTLASLQGQYYHRWSVLPRRQDGASASTLRRYSDFAAKDSRFHPVERQPMLFSTASPDADWFAALSPGDVLSNLALGAIAEEIARSPGARLIYTDEDALGESGRLHAPKLKPDWSPLFQSCTGYVGRLAAARKDALADAGIADPRLLATEERKTLDHILCRLGAEEILHLPRILYRRAATPRRSAIPTIAASPVPQWPRASIVIVTRDRADLLRECIDGIRYRTDYPEFDVVVVDNGTTEPDGLALLRSLVPDARFRVIRRPGAFNFSALSNDGAKLSNAELLVFMNNDIEMRDAHWLKALARMAMRPHIGVAGAKLLFPSGRIQHAGIALGLGTVAGHLYSGVHAAETGYLDQLATTREVCAVTAACCAIERKKFESLGGFDAVNLPVEFNDVDLCLRAREHGWSNVVVADSVLIHRESETRGVVLARTYDAERGIFVQRWSHVIREDPFFHPGLSLFALQPSLA